MGAFFPLADAEHFDVRLPGGGVSHRHRQLCRTMGELAGGGGHGTVHAGSAAPGGATLAASERVASHVRAMGSPPKDFTPATAVREVVKSTDYDGERVDVAVIGLGLLSLPPEGHRPVPLAGLSGAGGAAEIEQFCNGLIWPREVAALKKLCST